MAFPTLPSPMLPMELPTATLGPRKPPLPVAVHDPMHTRTRTRLDAELREYQEQIFVAIPMLTPTNP